MTDWHVAMLQEELDEGTVRCHVCPRLCRVAPGKSGVCRARVNRDGVLYAITYGRVCSVAADPIEKKPLYHFFPGTKVLSLGSVGCNFACRHCQNWQIAHADPSEATRDLRDLPVRNLAVLAANNACQGVAWTYNEPTIWFEYILDGAQAAHKHGLYTVMVTNGYITEDALAMLAPHIDAYRVDVKGFSNAQYKELCRIPDMRPVLESAERAKAAYGCHVEIVTNVIPTFNDDDTTLRGIATWIVERLGPETPWHVTRFMPYLEFSHLPPTPLSSLERAITIGHDAGLQFVYIGNVPRHDGENTICPRCRRLLVRRTGYAVEDVALRGTFCAMCGQNVNVRTTIKG
ncbi:MAG: AmmeMemoRadiSam system radical SAM enzyme [Actinobacteria bacterium]|nr:AmmeMemoRadiSam system radical SAM enzyme [Actinomycetota bacterium]